LRPFETDHYQGPPSPKARSLGYQIVRFVDKVKSEFRDLPQDELDALRREHGREYITEQVEDILLSVTGDTVPMPPSTYAGSRVLLHECTFLGIDEQMEEAERGHPHSFLDDVLTIGMEAQVGWLGLYHLSRRYDDDEILACVRSRCAEMELPC